MSDSEIPRTPHPDAEVLALFAAGRLDDSAHDRIQDHLAECSDCFGSVLQQPQDPLLAALRRMKPDPADASTRTADTPPRPLPPDIPPGLANHPRWRVLAKLGDGGMGSVYKAEHKLMQRPVVLKTIRNALSTNPDAASRFLREVRLAARLAHPNIVAVFDAEEIAGFHVLAMEYVEGTDLAGVVRRLGPLPVADAFEAARCAALGLQHAHERGLVHRDIKPSNLQLALDGTVKVLDFGLAMLRGESGGLTSDRQVLGTADFMAPEQWNNSSQVDIRADLYSLGCTLFCLLAGNPPFAGDDRATDIAKMMAHATVPPPAIRSLRTDVPSEAAAALARLLDKDPARRPQTPAEAAELLAPFAVGSDLPGLSARLREVAPSRAPITVAAPRGRPRVDPRLIAAAIVGAVALTFAVYSFRGTDVPDPKVEPHLVKPQVEPPDTKRIVKATDAKTVADPPPARQVLRTSDAGIHCVASADARRALVGAADGKVRLWEYVEGRELAVFTGHQGAVNAIAVEADGRHYVSAGTDGTVRRRRLTDVEGPGTARQVSTLPLRSVVFSRDGKSLLVAGDDGAIRLLDAVTLDETRAIRSSGDALRFCVFTPDGNGVLFTSADGRAIEWSLAADKETGSYDGFRSPPNAAAYSPDGTVVAISSPADGRLHLFDAATRFRVKQIKAHEGAVQAVAFSRDGKRVISGGLDAKVRVWDTASGSTAGPVRTFEEHTTGVRALALSADGRVLISGSEDRTAVARPLGE